jgi:hypothetical protein
LPLAASPMMPTSILNLLPWRYKRQWRHKIAQCGQLRRLEDILLSQCPVLRPFSTNLELMVCPRGGDDPPAGDGATRRPEADSKSKIRDSKSPSIR